MHGDLCWPASDPTRTFAIWVTVPGIILFFRTCPRFHLCDMLVTRLYQLGVKRGLSLVNLK